MFTENDFHQHVNTPACRLRYHIPRGIIKKEGSHVVHEVIFLSLQSSLHNLSFSNFLISTLFPSSASNHAHLNNSSESSSVVVVEAAEEAAAIQAKAQEEEAATPAPVDIKADKEKESESEDEDEEKKDSTKKENEDL